MLPPLNTSIQIMLCFFINFSISVFKQVAFVSHGTVSFRHLLPSRRDSFITVPRVRAKIQLREQSIYLVSMLLSSCGAGEGQSGAVGISKPLCHLDLSVTLFPFSKVFLSTSPYLGYLSDLAVLSLLPFPLFLCLVYPSCGLFSSSLPLCVFRIEHNPDTSDCATFLWHSSNAKSR